MSAAARLAVGLVLNNEIKFLKFCRKGCCRFSNGGTHSTVQIRETDIKKSKEVYSTMLKKYHKAE